MILQILHGSCRTHYEKNRLNINYRTAVYRLLCVHAAVVATKLYGLVLRLARWQTYLSIEAVSTALPPDVLHGSISVVMDMGKERRIQIYLEKIPF